MRFIHYDVVADSPDRQIRLRLQTFFAILRQRIVRTCMALLREKLTGTRMPGPVNARTRPANHPIRIGRHCRPKGR